MNNFTFYNTLRKLLQTYTKEQIFLRSSKSLGHAHKEVEVSANKITSTRTDVNSPTHPKDNIQNNEFIEVMNYFFGLLGNTSPLPNYMLDKIARHEDNGNGFSLLFDFFNNHILWLLYESTSLRNYHRCFQYDLNDRISNILLKILGFNNKESAKEYLSFAPLILSSRKPKYYIQKVLECNFNIHNKISIIENVAQRIHIPKTQQNKLGSTNNILGKNFLLGKTRYSYQNKIMLHIKDLHYQEALKYFPNKTQYNKLKESIAFLTNHEFAIDLCLDIKYHENMNFVLGDNTRAKLGLGLIVNAINKPSYRILFTLHK